MAQELDTSVKFLHLSTKQWFFEGSRRYGPDKNIWKLKCPKCGRIHTTKDYLRNPECMAFQDCVECGHRGKMVNNPITIHLERGLSDNIFDFADEPLTSC
jgi:Zn ribbon nucleic-acid-binding protein